MVYSSIPVAPSKEKEEDTSLESLELKGNSRHDRPEIVYPPSIFSDKRGNLKIVNLIVHHPCVAFVIILSLCVFITVDLARTAFKDGYPFTPDDSTFDLHDRRSLAYDGLRLAKEAVKIKLKTAADFNGSILVNGTTKRLQEQLGDVTYWIYEAKTDKGIFTKDSLPIMRSAEVMFTHQKKYPDYCLLQYHQEGNKTRIECAKELSVLNTFYASSWNSTVAKSIIAELTQQNIKLYNSVAACIEFNMLCQYLPPEVTSQDLIWAHSINQRIISMISFWDGEGPLNDNPQEVSLLLAHIKELHTKAPFVNFFVDNNFTIENPVAMFSRSVVYWGSPLEDADDSFRGSKTSSQNLLKKFIIGNFLEKLKEISSDNHSLHVQTYYFMGSLIFDIIVDILVSDAFKAILSFILVFLYLRLMLGSWLLASVGMLEIMLSLPLAWYFFSNILGIRYFSTLNVLCLFIVAAIGADDMFVFMDAYKQSAHKKELLVSMETRMSWVYRRSGNAMLITSATTCFAFLCTLFSPIASTQSFGIFAALVILFDYILVMTLFCTAVIIYHDRLEDESGCCSCFCCVKNDPSPTQVALSILNNNSEKVQSRINYFFKEKFAAGFILNQRYRQIVLFLMFIWLTISIWFTTKLQPTKTTEQALSKDHPLQRGATILSDKFPKVQQDKGTHIHFIWGLKEADRTGVNQLYDPNFTGNPSFVPGFAFNHQCQSKMLKICDQLKIDESFELLIKKNEKGLRNVQCFIEELGAYSTFGNLNDCDKVRSGEWKKNDSWQVNDTSILKSFADSQSCYSNSIIHQFYEDSFGWDGDSLQFAGVSFESSILDPYNTLPEDKVQTHYSSIIKLGQEFDVEMEEDCQGKVLITDLDQKFIFMNNQRIYRTSAVSGSMVGVLIAFVVLLVSTRKCHIALFATISIFSVLVSVIGSITMMGWTLGTNEAILMSILAGFSVDYVVHLAHAHVHANGSIDNRVKEAFSDMGISVFSGMLTSVIASIPLFMCTITFFAKFGTFLCLTILFSWLFANVGFMSLIAMTKIPIKSNRNWLNNE